VEEQGLYARFMQPMENGVRDLDFTATPDSKYVRLNE